MKVTVVTQAYNAKNYIAQCIESVLNQTYKDFEYILVDNGCDDGSEEIILQYTQQDSRIKLVRFESNINEARWYKPTIEMGTGDFFTHLDADDWIEPDYLERLVHLAETTGSDIVTTGTVMHMEGMGDTHNRTINQRFVIEKRSFADRFAIYHVFFRTSWAKLINMNIIKESSLLDPKKAGTSYGLDTVQTFLWLRNAERICIDNSVLHHYRVHQKSVSHVYDPRQSYSDLYLFNDAVNFLSEFGPVSQRNMDFLYSVYANAIKDTALNLVNSGLDPVEKMREFNKILLRQATKKAYAGSAPEVKASKRNLLSGVFISACELSEENDDFKAILEAHLPKCAAAVTVKNFDLFRLEKELLDALIDDDSELLVKNLLKMVSKQKYAKQFNDILGALRGLSRENPLLSEIADVDFLRRFGNIYSLLFHESFGEALDAMTDILLKEPPSNETFMILYVSLAAMLECVDEFIFGKIKLALFYVNGKRYDECRAVLSEISEMGVEDNDEIISIKRRLEN